jgi:hypothetical protein
LLHKHPPHAHPSLPSPTTTAIASYGPIAALSTAEVYAIYLAPGYPKTPSEVYVGCMEQCNGFSGYQAAYLAWNVTTPSYMGRRRRWR